MLEILECLIVSSMICVIASAFVGFAHAELENEATFAFIFQLVFILLIIVALPTYDHVKKLNLPENSIEYRTGEVLSFEDTLVKVLELDSERLVKIKFLDGSELETNVLAVDLERLK